MSILNFDIDTKKIKINDFKTAIDFLRYMDVRCNWVTDSYADGKKIPCFNERQLTYEEFYEWLNSVYIFIEKSFDFYSPNGKSFMNLKDFQIESLMNRYFEIYIIISFLAKQGSCVIYYQNESLGIMQESLTNYVNTSDFIQNFLKKYGRIHGLNKNKYKDYGRYIDEDDFLLDCFPFKLCRVNLCESSVQFSAMSYILKNNELYKLSKNILDEKYFSEYFNVNSKHKKEFDDIVFAANENQGLIKEFQDKLIFMYEECEKIFDADKQNILKSEIKQTEDLIEKLSGIRNLKKFIIEFPEILPYVKV